MKLKLSEQAIANIYPTGKGKKLARKTFLDVLNCEIREGETVEVANAEIAADYVASGLLEPADAESAKGVAAALEKRRAPHHTAAEKLKAELAADADIDDDRRAHLERQVESEQGYCAAFDAAIARIGPRKAAAQPQAKE